MKASRPFSANQPSSKSRSPIKNITTPTKPEKHSLEKAQQITMKRCKNLISYGEIDMLIEELHQNKEKLIPCLEIYEILQKSNLPQRCLIHNNIISLYCLNQRRLLCVNCIYGNQKHRSHRVNPVKDSMDEVHKDNQKLQIQILKEVDHLKNQQQIAVNNMRFLEGSLTHLLENLEKQFQDIVQQLTNKYIDLKKNLIDSFHQVMNKTKTISNQFLWFTDTISNMLQKIEVSKDDTDELRKHLLMIKLLELTGLKMKPFRREEIETLSRQLFKQMSQVRQSIFKHKWVK